MRDEVVFRSNAWQKSSPGATPESLLDSEAFGEAAVLLRGGRRRRRHGVMMVVVVMMMMVMVVMMVHGLRHRGGGGRSGGGGFLGDGVASEADGERCGGDKALDHDQESSRGRPLGPSLRNLPQLA
jgi:hypothetical protein